MLDDDQATHPGVLTQDRKGSNENYFLGAAAHTGCGIQINSNKLSTEQQVAIANQPHYVVHNSSKSPTYCVLNAEKG